VQRVVAYLVELYADEFLVLPAMHYRWGTAEGEAAARADFSSVTGDHEFSQRFADRMSGSLGLLGVGPDTVAPIEAHTHELLAALCAHFEVHTILLGARPSLADCALMGPLYAHLRFDPVPQRLLRAKAIPVLQWIERMNHPQAKRRGHPQAERPGSPEIDEPTGWLPDDALAPTLRPLLALIGRDAIPLLHDNLVAVDAWLDANGAPGSTPPRALGMHRTTLRGVEFNRYTSPYGLWMWQRPLDAYRALDEGARALVRSTLAGTGAERLLDSAPRRRVGKQGNALIVEG
jgi:glutathione S-transferase